MIYKNVVSASCASLAPRVVRPVAPPRRDGSRASRSPWALLPRPTTVTLPAETSEGWRTTGRVQGMRYRVGAVPDNVITLLYVRN